MPKFKRWTLKVISEKNWGILEIRGLEIHLKRINIFDMVSLEFQGGTPKIVKKHGFPKGGGINAKKWKIPGGKYLVLDGFITFLNFLLQSINIFLQRFDDSCLLYTSPSPRDGLLSRMPSSA